MQASFKIPENPKMIIFDYGGTILYEPGFSFLNGERAVFEHVVKNPMNVTPEEICDFNERIFSESGKARQDEFELHHFQMLRMKYEYFNIELDISYERAEEILWDNVSAMSKKCCMPNVEELLQFLKEQKIRTGVISNMGWSGKALERRINTILPQNEFEFILTSSEYGYRKPNPLLFELALRKSGLEAKDVWFCGDTFDADIVGANRVGIFPIYYQGTAKTDDGPKRKNFHPKTKTNFKFLTITDWNELISLIKCNII